VTNASLRPLRRRNFALVWSAALVSNIGSWMQTVAVGVFVTEVTGQAKWTGLVAAAAFVPIGFLSPVGGAMADRVDRRKWLLLTTIGETVFAALLAVLVGLDMAGPGAVSLLVLLGGCMTAVGIPSYQAMLPDLVEPDDLLAAISLTSAQYNFGRVVGPALAGVVIALGSYTLAFALNAASFFAVIIALLFVHLPPPVADGDESGLWSRIKQGARAAAREPGCRMAILLIGVAAFLLSPFIALVPAVALKLFDNERTGTAILVTAQGVGAVAGALALAPLAMRFGRRRTLVLNLFVLPGLLMVYALTPELWLAAIALFVVGAGYIGILSGLMTVVQLRAPTAVRGRVLSLFMVALGTIYPIGAVVQGALGDRIGLRATTISGAAVFFVLFTSLVLRRPDLVDALDDPPSVETSVTAPEETSAATMPVV
jgi:MFS family permease